MVGLSFTRTIMRVVGVHVIAHTHLTAPQIEAEWLPALQGGLEEAGFPRIAQAEFAIAAYGKLFRPDGTHAVGLSKLMADDLSEWEQSLLLDWWQEAANLSERNRREPESNYESGDSATGDRAGNRRYPRIDWTFLRVDRCLRMFVCASRMECSYSGDIYSGDIYSGDIYSGDIRFSIGCWVGI
jgi:hypothetical protein